MKGGEHRPPPQALPGLGQGSRPLWSQNPTTKEKVLLREAHQGIKSCPCQASGVMKESSRSVLLCILTVLLARGRKTLLYVSRHTACLWCTRVWVGVATMQKRLRNVS